MAQAYGACWVVQEDAMDGSLQAEWDGHMIWCWEFQSTGVLYGVSFDLLDMERGELCHDRCVCLLLDDYVQDVGRQPTKTNAEKAIALALYSSEGFG